MRTIVLLLLMVAVAVAGVVGCGGPQVTEADAAERQKQYRRIAIVCAPAQGADPAHAKMILDEVSKRLPARLGWLDAADCLPGVAVDVSKDPPQAVLGAKAKDYDAVVCLVYEYGGGHTILNMHVVNTQTGALVWHHKLDTADPNVQARLLRHALWTPTIIKLRFYGKKK